jgi:hypothetical protein
VKSTNIFPKNKNKFVKLIGFAKEIIGICQKLKIVPIIYGSYAYFIYTNNEHINVNDIDFYISEKNFNKITKILDEKKIKYHHDKKWRTIQVFKDDLKIELDSIEKWYGYNHKNKNPFNKFHFYGNPIKILSLEALTKIYKRASEVSNKPKKNLKKYQALKKFK